MSKDIVEEKGIAEEYVFDIDDEPEEYELEVLGNRERPPENRMRVELVPLSAADYARAFRGTDQNDIEVTASEKLFCARVRKLRNFRFRRSNGDVFEVTDPSELFRLRSEAASRCVTDIQNRYEKREGVDTGN